MRDIGITQGSASQAQPLIIGKDTVYVHTDINPVMDAVDMDGNKIEGLYEYHEVQYTKDEYISVISQKNIEIENEVTTVQMSICDLYESLLGDS